MSEARPRGRPRRYDPDRAMDAAVGAFLAAGFSGTSLDRLSEATGMNRPSLYGAFGDKEALYLKALAHYAARLDAALDAGMGADRPVAKAIEGYLNGAIDHYTADGDAAKGCLVVCTATAEAAATPAIREALAAVLARIDRALEARLRSARDSGELPAATDPAALAALIGAVQHSLAVRARAGTSRRQLRRIARDAVGLLLR